MIALDIQIDVASFADNIARNARQLPFAMARAINWTNETKQTAIHSHVESALSIRQRQARSIFREVVRYGNDNRADSKAGRLTGEIVVLGRDRMRSPAHRTISQILLRQDDAGTQRSSAMYRAQSGELTIGGFVVPSQSGGYDRNASKGMDPKLYPAAIGLTERRAIDGSMEFANRYKGGRTKRGGFRSNTAYYFVMEGVGIFQRRPLKKTRQQRALARRPKQFKRDSSLYFGDEWKGALSKAMKSGSGSRVTRANGDRSRGYEDFGSEYTQIWHFQKTIDLPQRVNILAVFDEGIEDLFYANFDKAFAQAIATAR